MAEFCAETVVAQHVSAPKHGSHEVQPEMGSMDLEIPSNAMVIKNRHKHLVIFESSQFHAAKLESFLYSASSWLFPNRATLTLIVDLFVLDLWLVVLLCVDFPHFFMEFGKWDYLSPLFFEHSYLSCVGVFLSVISVGLD